MMPSRGMKRISSGVHFIAREFTNVESVRSGQESIAAHATILSVATVLIVAGGKCEATTDRLKDHARGTMSTVGPEHSVQALK